MEIAKGGRMNRPGSRLRRQRSQEWQDYSSSDNDDDLERQGYRYSDDHTHQYEDPRIVVDSRKHDGVFGDSPPEPAPASLPSRTTPPVYHIEALGRRPRLGYLESECESEPPYLPNMLSGGLSSFESQEINNQTQAVPESTPACTNDGNDIRASINKLNKADNERIYSQPQQVLIPKTEGTASATSTATTATPNAPPTSTPNAGGPTYSNPLPVFCSTPSSTTGPMVPVPNCVNPQLIQPATAPARVRQPFSPASAFSSTAMSSSRFHFQKSCSHRCSWKMSTIVLIFVTTILTATMTYFAAMSSLSVYPESNKPCIVVADRENARSTTGPTEMPSSSRGMGLPAQSACLVGLTSTDIYKNHYEHCLDQDDTSPRILEYLV